MHHQVVRLIPIKDELELNFSCRRRAAKNAPLHRQALTKYSSRWRAPCATSLSWQCA